MKKTIDKKALIRVLLCVIWIVLIFYNGTRPGKISQKSSHEVIKVASKVMHIKTSSIDKPGIQLSEINYYVRKNAHFIQYFILSILLCSAARQFKLCTTSQIFIILFLLLLFPLIDEVIQKYIPGRTSNIFDIVIDFSGGVLAMIISNILLKYRKVEAIVKTL